MSPHPLELLPLHAAGTLEDEEKALVDAHLSSCAACAAEARRWGALVAGLRRLESPMVGRGLSARTREVVERRRAEREQQAWTWAGLGFLVALGWTLTAVVWLLVQLMLGMLAGHFDRPLGSTAAWFALYLLAGWAAGGAAALLLGRGAHEEGRMV